MFCLYHTITRTKKFINVWQKCSDNYFIHLKKKTEGNKVISSFSYSFSQLKFAVQLLWHSVAAFAKN